MKLGDLKQWVCWRHEERDGRRTKVPYSPATGDRARTDDPSTWETYEEARSAARERGYDGVGFVFTAGDHFCGIDLDDCIDAAGSIEPWAMEILNDLESYTEFSPSGAGLHIIVRARLPIGGNRKDGIEMYDRGRFFTVTGNHLSGSPRTIRERQKEISALHARLFSREAARSGSANHALTDEEIIARATRSKNGDRFARLWRGDRAGYRSDSEADLALCSMLAFWCGPDEERITALFSRSGLVRDKWNREDYRKRTVRKAIDGTRHFHIPEPAVSAAPRRAPEAPPFPVEAMPEPCRRLVREATASLNCAPELIALPMLAALSSAIGASRVVEVKGGWREGAALFLAVVASPGAMKTPAAKVAKAPVFERQRALGRDYADKKEEYRRGALRWEVEKKEAGKRGEVHEDAPPAPPAMSRCIAGDTTVEALVSVLEDNPRGILVHRDELAGWVRSMDQYKGGKGSDRQNWLNLWSADEVIVDRKSRFGEPIILAKPFVSLFGGIQPAMLSELGGQGSLEDGLMDRFLFAYPAVRHIRFTEEEISPEAQREYADLYRALAELPLITDEHGDPNPMPLKLTFEVRRCFAGVVDELGAETLQPGFPARLEGVWSKLRGYLARLALLLAVCRIAGNPGAPQQVEKEDVLRAAALLDYFKVHARRVYSELAAPDPLDALAGELCGLLRDIGGAWEGSATELLHALEDRDTADLPDRPEELSKLAIRIAERTVALEVRQGWRRIGGGSARVLRIALKNVENAVDAVVTVDGEQNLPPADNSDNGNNGNSSVGRTENVALESAPYTSSGDHVAQFSEEPPSCPTEEERIRAVLTNPPGWMRDTYLRGYQEDRWDAGLVSAGVAAALDLAPHEDGPRIRPVVEETLADLDMGRT